jgi:hypothetical protein
LRQYYADKAIQEDTFNFTDHPMESLRLNTTFVEQPTGFSQTTEFPLLNLTDSIATSSDLTTLLPFLSEETTLDHEKEAATPSFNSTLPRLLDTDTAIYIYTAFIVGSVFITSIRSVFFFKVCMTASKILHDTMFGCILGATMRFFDTNPSGKPLVIIHFHMVYICSVIVFI